MRFYNKLLEIIFEIVKVSRLRPSLRGLKRDGFTKLLYSMHTHTHDYSAYIYIYIYMYIHMHITITLCCSTTVWHSVASHSFSLIV